MFKNRKSNKNDKKKFTKEVVTIIHEENPYKKYLNKRKSILSKEKSDT